MDKLLILNNLQELYGYEKDSEFAKYLGISSQTLSNWKSRNTFDIELLYTKCENINPEYLFTGNGSVFKKKYPDNENSSINIVSEPEVNEFKLKTDKLVPGHQQIPLYNIEATAGIVTLFRDTDQTQPIDFIQVPNLPKCDGALYVTGDSMYPLLKSGDIVMYKQVHNIRDGIFWGEMYLISIVQDGDEMVLVKYIQKSEKGDDWIRLVSQNQHHQDKDIKLTKVKALALVKASIRINSML